MSITAACAMRLADKRTFNFCEVFVPNKFLCAVLESNVPVLVPLMWAVFIPAMRVAFLVQ